MFARFSRFLRFWNVDKNKVYFLLKKFCTPEIFNFVETANINTREKKSKKTPEFLGIFHPCDK